MQQEYRARIRRSRRARQAFIRCALRGHYGNPFHEPETLGQGNGLEAMRVLMCRYEPRTTQSKPAYISKSSPAPVRPSEWRIWTHVPGPDRNSKGYEDLVGKSLDEYLLVVALTEACVPELRTKPEVRDLVASYIKRRRDVGSHPVPMDIGNKE